MNKKRLSETFSGSVLPFYDEFPSDCSFEGKNYPEGTTVHNDDTNINYLIFCRTGHIRISSGVALSDATLPTSTRTAISGLKSIAAN